LSTGRKAKAWDDIHKEQHDKYQSLHEVGPKQHSKHIMHRLGPGNIFLLCQVFLLKYIRESRWSHGCQINKSPYQSTSGSKYMFLSTPYPNNRRQQGPSQPIDYKEYGKNGKHLAELIVSLCTEKQLCCRNPPQECSIREQGLENGACSFYWACIHF